MRAKTYYRQDNIRTAKYTVSFHNGIKKNRDRSPFYDIRIFRNKKRMQEFIRELKEQGYRERR